jgi:hypothetical protein
MADADMRNQISRIEADIEELAKTLEGCRKAMLLSKVAIVSGGISILGYLLGAIWFCGYDQRNGCRYWGHRHFWIKFEYIKAGDESCRDTQSRVDRPNQSSNCRREPGRHQGLGSKP